MKTRTHFTFRVDTWAADGARPPDGVRSHSLPRLHTRRKNSARLRRPGWPHQAPFRRRSAPGRPGQDRSSRSRMTTGMTGGRCAGGLFFAGAALCGGRWCAKRRRAYPGPTQARFSPTRPAPGGGKYRWLQLNPRAVWVGNRNRIYCGRARRSEP